MLFEFDYARTKYSLQIDLQMGNDSHPYSNLQKVGTLNTECISDFDYVNDINVPFMKASFVYQDKTGVMPVMSMALYRYADVTFLNTGSLVATKMETNAVNANGNAAFSHRFIITDMSVEQVLDDSVIYSVKLSAIEWWNFIANTPIDVAGSSDTAGNYLKRLFKAADLKLTSEIVPASSQMLTYIPSTHDSVYNSMIYLLNKITSSLELSNKSQSMPLVCYNDATDEYQLVVPSQKNTYVKQRKDAPSFVEVINIDAQKNLSMLTPGREFAPTVEMHNTVYTTDVISHSMPWKNFKYDFNTSTSIESAGDGASHINNSAYIGALQTPSAGSRYDSPTTTLGNLYPSGNKPKTFLTNYCTWFDDAGMYTRLVNDFVGHNAILVTLDGAIDRKPGTAIELICSSPKAVNTSVIEDNQTNRNPDTRTNRTSELYNSITGPWLVVKVHHIISTDETGHKTYLNKLVLVRQ